MTIIKLNIGNLKSIQSFYYIYYMYLLGIIIYYFLYLLLLCNIALLMNIYIDYHIDYHYRIFRCLIFKVPYHSPIIYQV